MATSSAVRDASQPPSAAAAAVQGASRGGSAGAGAGPSSVGAAPSSAGGASGGSSGGSGAAAAVDRLGSVTLAADLLGMPELTDNYSAKVRPAPHSFCPLHPI